MAVFVHARGREADTALGGSQGGAGDSARSGNGALGRQMTTR